MRAATRAEKRLGICYHLLNSVRFDFLMARLQQRQRDSPHLRPQEDQRVGLNKEQKEPALLSLQNLVLLRLRMELRLLPHDLKEDQSGLPDEGEPNRHNKHLWVDPHRALQHLKEQGMREDRGVQHLRDVG